MTRRLRERQAELEPDRTKYAIDQLTRLGYEVEQVNRRTLRFVYNGSPILLYPYTGWHTGKTIKDGRGIKLLLKQLTKI